MIASIRGATPSELAYVARKAERMGVDALQLDLYAPIGPVLAELYTSPDLIAALCRGIHRDQQGFEAMLRYVRNVTALDGACFLVKKQTWQALGGFHAAADGYETVEFCLAGVKQGLDRKFIHKR